MLSDLYAYMSLSKNDFFVTFFNIHITVKASFKRVSFIVYK